MGVMRRETVWLVFERWGRWEETVDCPHLAFAERAEATRCAALHEARLMAQGRDRDDFYGCYVTPVEVVRP